MLILGQCPVQENIKNSKIQKTLIFLKKNRENFLKFLRLPEKKYLNILAYFSGKNIIQLKIPIGLLAAKI